VKIGINGGLGNQLFQISFGHQECSKNLELYLDGSPRVDRPYELKKLTENCSHVAKVRNLDTFTLKLRIKISRVPRRIRIDRLQKLFNKLTKIDIEEVPFSDKTKWSSRQNLSLGYFQHWKLVEESWPQFGLEIIETLRQISINEPIIYDITETIVIHIRQGDLIDSKLTMGILDVEYYLEAISEIKRRFPEKEFKLVAMTDDMARAREIGKNIPFSLILDPTRLNAWETLKIMSSAHYLVCANSTLSWWGAFINSKNGGVSVLPSPWFRNWHESVGDAFNFPGATLIKSSFLE
jgi:Glycosyl transferase family 11